LRDLGFLSKIIENDFAAVALPPTCDDDWYKTLDAVHDYPSWSHPTLLCAILMHVSCVPAWCLLLLISTSAAAPTGAQLFRRTGDSDLNPTHAQRIRAFSRENSISARSVPADNIDIKDRIRELENSLEGVKSELAANGFIPQPKSRSFEPRDWSIAQEPDEDDPDGVDADDDD